MADPSSPLLQVEELVTGYGKKEVIQQLDKHRTLPTCNACHANAAQAKVTKVEFLGAFCHVTVAIADAGEQLLLINVSRHSIDRMNLAEGSALQVGLPADCMRLLA